MGRFAMMLYFLVGCYGSCIGQTYSDMDRLHQNLTSRYNKNIRPTESLKEPTLVEMGFSLIHIKEFEEKPSRLGIIGMLMFEWRDCNMVWDHRKYGGIKTFLIPQNDVWKPELFLGNAFSSIQPLGFDRLNIRVRSDGMMSWIPANVYETPCKADITYYPFDEHTCSLYFVPWMYLPKTELVLYNKTAKPDTYMYSKSGQWELIDTGIRVNTGVSIQEFIVTIKFRRRPLFNIVNILIPASVIGLLITLVFLLPAESGERVGFSITVLLALTVFLTIVSESLPNTSDPNIPRISYLLAGDLVISTLATLCTVLGLRLHHKPEANKVPMWLQYFTCAICWSCKVSRRNISNLDRSQTNSSGLSDIYHRGNFKVKEDYTRNDKELDDLKQKSPRSTTREDILMTNQTEVSRYQKDAAHDDVIRTDTVTWKHIASFFDAFCFVFFLLLVVIKNVFALAAYNGY
ncbi:neuronal acetylcholine receptor subunit alpha-6-like [Mizuhopecten yessoensis]|uniref:Neuronal acetylcholine receptor subunit alpha-6 n=1 Tax=Mizuhopecten yessoensis TaxID=6573 RepID=A0A210QIF5_MIZYE|nr:neuronal acetylcholine receptor subunit alpha-6-like [Mizuhopecten yessoensis]OWF48381.1 Neuronal acetylcholine receptor subunit alpha-6 [Mizuhopecten yessoensis]